MSRTAWADNETYAGEFDGSSHSLLQSIYGSQTSQILLSSRQSEAQLVIEEADEDGWSEDDNVTVPVRPSSSQQGSPSPAVRQKQTAARPRTALPYSSHNRSTPVSSSTSLVSAGYSRGGIVRPSSAMQRRPSSGRPPVHKAAGHEQKQMRRRPMSAAVPRSYSVQAGSRRSSLGGGAAGQSQVLNRPRPKSAFVGSTRSTPLLDYDSSEEDQSAARAPLRNSNPVFRTHVPEYINFWGGKPLQNRDFGAVVHERKSWKRPKSDYGNRGASSRKSSVSGTDIEKRKVSDELITGIGDGDSGVQGLDVKEAWGGPSNSGTGGEVGGCHRCKDRHGLGVKEAWSGPSQRGGEVGGCHWCKDRHGLGVKEAWSGPSQRGGEVGGCLVDKDTCGLNIKGSWNGPSGVGEGVGKDRCDSDVKEACDGPSGMKGEMSVCLLEEDKCGVDAKESSGGSGVGREVGGCLVDANKRGESGSGPVLRDGGGLMQGKGGHSHDKDKNGAGFGGIGGSLLDGLVNVGNADSSGKPPKRDTSENDRNRKAYRSGTVSLPQHSENRYGKSQNDEDGSAGSEEEDFFKKSADDILPTIPSSTSLTGGSSKGGLDSVEEVASRSADSVSDEERAVVLPPLVASPPDLLVPPKSGPSNTPIPVCPMERYHLESDTISETQTLDDKPPSNATWLGARLALTRHSTRFELPLDLRDLQGLSPADYLQKYTVVSERRAAHYTKVYRRFLKPTVKSIARKDLVPALREVHFGTVDEEQIMEVLAVVQLAENVNAIGIKLFAGLCAFAERMLRAYTLTTRSTTALTEYGQHREIVEDADFEALEWKLRGCTIEDSLQALFAKL